MKIQVERNEKNIKAPMVVNPTSDVICARRKR